MYLFFSSQVLSSVKFKNYIVANNLSIQCFDITDPKIFIMAQKNGITRLPSLLTNKGQIFIGKECLNQVQRCIMYMKKSKPMQNTIDLCPINNQSWTPPQLSSAEELKKLMTPRHNLLPKTSLNGLPFDPEWDAEKNPIAAQDWNKELSEEEIKQIKRPNKQLFGLDGLNGQKLNIPQKPSDPTNDALAFQPITVSHANKSDDRRVQQMKKERENIFIY